MPMTGFRAARQACVRRTVLDREAAADRPLIVSGARGCTERAPARRVRLGVRGPGGGDVGQKLLGRLGPGVGERVRPGAFRARDRQRGERRGAKVRGRARRRHCRRRRRAGPGRAGRPPAVRSPSPPAAPCRTCRCGSGRRRRRPTHTCAPAPRRPAARGSGPCGNARRSAAADGPSPTMTFEPGRSSARKVVELLFRRQAAGIEEDRPRQVPRPRAWPGRSGRCRRRATSAAGAGKPRAASSAASECRRHHHAVAGVVEATQVGVAPAPSARTDRAKMYSGNRVW